nr:PREDICTED: 30S ribosomal protein S31, chloroplastic [Musa acuminata subsp. malaccensis]
MGWAKKQFGPFCFRLRPLDFSSLGRHAPRLIVPSSSSLLQGDKKTAKGKRFKHSLGNARPRDKTRGRGPPRAPVPPSPPKKDRFDDGEIVKIEIDESLFS